MGWADCGNMTALSGLPESRGQLIGRPIGYGIWAICDTRNCATEIDRGLGYVCGDMHHPPFSDEPGCGRYYCAKHLGTVGPRGGCGHRSKYAYGATL